MKNSNDEMKKGMTLSDPLGRRLYSYKKWCSIPDDDNKCAYLPVDKTFGTAVEILEQSKW